MQKQFYTLLLSAVIILSITKIGSAQVRHIIYTSDNHYGISRTFRGKEDVETSKVLRAMISKMNMLPTSQIPDDGGVGASTKVGDIELIVNSGDMVNRMQSGAANAVESWSEFNRDWSRKCKLRDRNGDKLKMLMTIGNHEASNTIGSHKIVQKLDTTVVVDIYNRMVGKNNPIAVADYDFKKHIVHYSYDVAGVKLLFLNIWPDSKEREWAKQEIKRMGGEEPILLFTHDSPMVEVKHLINPNGDHSKNEIDKFENILADTSSVVNVKMKPVKEMNELAEFLKSNDRIKAYFHGDYNYSEFYNFTDSVGNDVVPVFRVDSPMKGEYSRDDESKLSFMLISIDNNTLKMSCREVLWNSSKKLEWGDIITVELR